MKRVKRVLTKDGHPGIIDLHSANQFNQRDGFINSAVLYLEHFPYLNRLWFGEYFDYERNSPDFFLTEVSGIPFGLMGEMLERRRQPLARHGVRHDQPDALDRERRPAADLEGLGRLRHGGVADDRLLGGPAPVKTGRPDVLATVYKKPGAALVALGELGARTDTDVRWRSTGRRSGIDPARAVIVAPAIDELPGCAGGSRPGDAIPVAPGQGVAAHRR